MIARTPVAYAYGRVSHRDQIEKDESVPAQLKRAEGYFKCHLEPKGVVWGGVEFDTFNVSAYRKPFFKRKAGLRLLEKLHNGDYLIVDKVDRIWRSITDFADVDRMLNSIGVKICFVDYFGCSLERGTPMGDYMLLNLVNLAQLESAMISHRIRADRKMRREGKLWDYSTPIMGTKVVGKGKNRTLIWDQAKRAVMRDIVEMVRDHKMSYSQVALLLECKKLHKEGKPIPDNITSTFCKRTWTLRKVEMAYHRELLYQKLSDLSPAELQLYCLAKYRRLGSKPSVWSDYANVRSTGSRDVSRVDSNVSGTDSQPATESNGS